MTRRLVVSPSTADDLYRLTRVLQNALRASEDAEQFVHESQTQSPELVPFFQDIREQNLRLAEEARELLRTHLATQPPAPREAEPLHPLSEDEKVDESVEETFPASDPPAY
jgi:hypothetical protein